MSVDRMCAKSLSRVWLFVTLWTVVCQVPHLWASPGKNTGVGCLALLQGIFPIQRYKLCLVYLLHWQTGSLPLALPGKPLFLLQNSWTKSQGREKVVNHTDLHPNTEYFLPLSVSKNLRTLDVTCANYLYFEQYMSVWRLQASVKLHKIFGSIELRSQRNPLALSLRKNSACRERRGAETSSGEENLSPETSGENTPGYKESCCHRWQMGEGQVWSKAGRTVGYPKGPHKLEASAVSSSLILCEIPGTEKRWEEP